MSQYPIILWANAFFICINIKRLILDKRDKTERVQKKERGEMNLVDCTIVNCFWKPHSNYLKVIIHVNLADINRRLA